MAQRIARKERHVVTRITSEQTLHASLQRARADG